MRTFIAIGLPQEAKAGVARVQSQLDRAGKGIVRWVSADGMHLTLKFLGEISEDMAPKVEEALGEAVKGVSPFGLEAAELGFFPNATRPRVFWIGLKGDVPALLRLQDNVEIALSKLGFQREAREFSPHLTLARFKDYALPEQRKLFSEQAAKLKVSSCWAIPVDGINLMKSSLNPSGPVYSELARVRLEE